jgi:hypothetical protein
VFDLVPEPLPPDPLLDPPLDVSSLGLGVLLPDLLPDLPPLELLPDLPPPDDPPPDEVDPPLAVLSTSAASGMEQVIAHCSISWSLFSTHREKHWWLATSAGSSVVAAAALASPRPRGM